MRRFTKGAGYQFNSSVMGLMGIILLSILVYLLVRLCLYLFERSLIYRYDLLTKLLYGARYTVFVTLAIALLRVILGTVIGLYLGMQDEKQKRWISVENAWSYIPIFIPVYFLLGGINVNSDLSTSTLVAIFIGVVTILGIPSVVSSIRQKMQQLKEMQYVLAAASLGAGRSQIVLRHILPQIKEQVLLVLVMEMIAIMTLMGLLGMFDQFVGGTIMNFDPVLYHSVTNEWAGLLGAYRGFIYSSYPWIYLVPLLAYQIHRFTVVQMGLPRFSNAPTCSQDV